MAFNHSRTRQTFFLKPALKTAKDGIHTTEWEGTGPMASTMARSGLEAIFRADHLARQSPRGYAKEQEMRSIPMRIQEIDTES